MKEESVPLDLEDLLGSVAHLDSAVHSVLVLDHLDLEDLDFHLDSLVALPPVLY